MPWPVSCILFSLWLQCAGIGYALEFEEPHEIPIIYADNKIYLVGEQSREPPHGVWKAIDRWIYLGTEDPYCYIEVAYDTWWLQAANIKQHCLQEFNRMQCILHTATQLSSTTGWFQVARIEDCLGIRGTVKRIMNERDNWHRLHYYAGTGSKTPGGVLHAVMVKGKAIQVHADYTSMSLWYDSNGFHNADLVRGLRAWIDPGWVQLGRANTLKDLVRSRTWITPTKLRVSAATRIRKHPCNCVLTNGTKIRVGNFVYQTSLRLGEYQLGCDGHVCECESVHYESLISSRAEPMQSIDREQGIISKVFSLFGSFISNGFNTLLNAIFGTEVFNTIICIALVFYVSSRILQSLIAGALTSALAYMYVLKD